MFLKLHQNSSLVVPLIWIKTVMTLQISHKSANGCTLAVTLSHVRYLNRDPYNISIDVFFQVLVTWKVLSLGKFFRLGISFIISEVKLFFLQSLSLPNLKRKLNLCIRGTLVNLNLTCVKLYSVHSLSCVLAKLPFCFHPSGERTKQDI